MTLTGEIQYSLKVILQELIRIKRSKDATEVYEALKSDLDTLTQKIREILNESTVDRETERLKALLELSNARVYTRPEGPEA